jgi:predicted porin
MFNLGEISMKKSLVALAALAATTAFAQSSVTLYGVADVWLGNQKTTTTVNGVSSGVGQNLMGSGGINGSRFGLRGSEDLGGGLKANFQLENGFNIDSGAAAQGSTATPPVAASGLLFGRQAFVGLSGGFGAVTFGRQYTAYDEARGGADLMGHSAFSPTAGAVWSAGRAYGFRANNTIRYGTNNFGGFTAAVTYSLGENKTTAGSAGATLALHGAYNNGPIAVFAAYQQEKNPTGSGASTLLNGGFENATAGVTSETHALISGAYDLGVAKLRVAYNQSKDNAPGTASADKEFTFGVAAPLGPVTLEAEFATMKNNAVKSRGFGIQAKYNLSKRTFAYAGIQNAKTTDTPAGVSGSESKLNLVAVGIRHGF